MSFRIKVVDQYGYPCKNHRVNIYWKEGGQSKSQTNNSGNAEFAGNGGVAASITVVDKKVDAGVKLEHGDIHIVEYRR